MAFGLRKVIQCILVCSTLLLVFVRAVLAHAGPESVGFQLRAETFRQFLN